jgi:hypothetical protein
MQEILSHPLYPSKTHTSDYSWNESIAEEVHDALAHSETKSVRVVALEPMNSLSKSMAIGTRKMYPGVANASGCIPSRINLDSREYREASERLPDRVDLDGIESKVRATDDDQKACPPES